MPFPKMPGQVPPGAGITPSHPVLCWLPYLLPAWKVSQPKENQIFLLGREQMLWSPRVQRRCAMSFSPTLLPWFIQDLTLRLRDHSPGAPGTVARPGDLLEYFPDCCFPHRIPDSLEICRCLTGSLMRLGRMTSIICECGAGEGQGGSGCSGWHVLPNPSGSMTKPGQDPSSWVALGTVPNHPQPCFLVFS